jgi:hypothetical protein
MKIARNGELEITSGTVRSGGKESLVFKRPAQEAQSSSLTLCPSSASAHQLQGHLYCAGLNIIRASEGVLTARELDFLYSSLCNLEDLARKAGVAEADVADFTRWRVELEGRMREARQREAFERRAPMPLVQLETVDLHPEPLREIA